MPGADSVAALGFVYTGRDRRGRVRTLATGYPTNGVYDRTSRYDAANAYELIYREAGAFYQSISSAMVGPAVGSSILILFGRSEYLHFADTYLLLENRTDSEMVLNRLDSIDVPGRVAGVTWDDFTTSLCVVHGARQFEIRVSARDVFTQMWNEQVDRSLAESGGAAERVGGPRFEWRAFCDSAARRTFEPLGEFHFLTVGQRLRLHGPGVIPDYDASMTYHLALAPAGAAVTGWVAAWDYSVSDGFYHEYMAALVQPYVALGAERLSDALEQVPLPLPGGVQVRDVYYLPGDQSTPPAEGRRRIRTGRTYGDATVVLELGT